MSDKSLNPLDPIRKGQEEEYFRKQNAELAKKLKARAEMSDSGVHDPHLADQLIAAGFDKDSIRALDFIPIVDVAWVDQVLQREEKDAILKILDVRGISKASKAHQIVSQWLDAKPSDSYYLSGKALLEPMLAEAKSTGGARWILTAAERVAAVTGGVFGMIGSKISPEEKSALEGLARKIK